jgi:PAS domain S-box-containing protein
MRIKSIMVFCGIFFILSFSIFVLSHQDRMHTGAMAQIRDHADIIASSLWTFEKSSPTAYLTLAAKANGYERLSVSDDRGRAFLEIKGPARTRCDKFFVSAGLIPRVLLEADVEYEGKAIGKISAVWPSRAIYTHFYILFCMLLVFMGIWLFLKLLDSNRTLESRVQSRTAELEKENRERRQTEKALRLSEERLRLALEGNSDGIWDWDLTTGLAYFDARYYTMLGYESNEFPSSYESWKQLLHPDDVEPSELEVRKAIKNHAPFAMEFRFKAKNGDWRWILSRAKVVELDESGGAMRMAGTHTDVTERRRAEDALRKYERIVSTSKDLMALVNRDYRYEAVNTSVLAAHNKARNDVVGKTMAEVIGESVFREKIQWRIDEALRGEVVHVQEPFDFEGFGRRIMDISFFPMFDEAGKVEGVVFNARDVTETRQLEEKLIQSQKMESIGTLAGGVAHEINNPINGIMNYAQLIMDKSEHGTPAAEMAEEIIRETQRVARIVRNLLTFARNEKQSHSKARLSDIVSSVLSLILTVMRHDQIDLRIEIPDDLPSIKCRSQQIQQVLMNLMTNARDALNQKYPRFSPEKQLSIRARHIDKGGRAFIRITVEDSGTGIPPEILARIFDPFFTTKPKESGTGLGLSISYGIVKEHHGELVVESEPGCYTRFHVDLPVDNGWDVGYPEADGTSLEPSLAKAAR